MTAHCNKCRFLRPEQHAILLLLLMAVALFSLPHPRAFASDIKSDIFSLRPGEHRDCVSLRVLSERVSAALASNKPISQKDHTLGGIGYIEGYIYDRGSPNDIILFGTVSKDRPSLKLDDLIANMRSIRNGSGYPYCSLDPRPENINALNRLFSSSGALNSLGEMNAFFKRIAQTVGPQEVIVGGVPRDSRHAHVMIEADYHMKKVSQGHINLKGISSYMDHSLNEAQAKIKKGESIQANKMSMARFWFHIGENSPKFHRERRYTVMIDHCKVVILTEKQKSTASGELVDVVEDDPHAVAFANEMSEFLSVHGAPDVPCYADLENLFRLRALLLSMDFQSAFSSVGWSFSSFIPDYKYIDDKPMQPSMPGLSNYKEWTHTVRSGATVYTYVLFPMVCGGVGMDMTVSEKDFRDDLASRLFLFRMAALMARPSKDTLSWTVP